MNRLARLFGVAVTVVTTLLAAVHGVEQAPRGADQFLDGIWRNESHDAVRPAGRAENGRSGAEVRVIWPAPVDNKQVAPPGS